MIKDSRKPFTGRELDSNFGGRGRRYRSPQKHINQAWRGIQHSALQLDRFVLGRHMREITSRRVTARAMPVTVEERSALLRVTRDQIADLVGKAIADVSRSRMQKGRNIGDLLGGKRRERRHPSLRPPVSDNGADHITLVVMEHQSRAHKIWPALPVSIIAVTKSARRHKNLPPAL